MPDPLNAETTYIYIYIYIYIYMFVLFQKIPKTYHKYHTTLKK